jgi:hypothetical protein
LTAATLLASVLLSFLIGWWIYKLYLPAESKTRIDIQGMSGYDISGVEIYIEYSLGGEDRVSTYISLQPTSNEAIGKTFFIVKSPNLTYQREGSFFAGLEYFDCQPNFSLCLRFRDTERRTVILNFTGNVFGHGNQDERLHFTSTVSKNAAIDNIPVKVVVSNLSEVNLSTVSPEPTKRYTGGLIYNFEPGAETLSLNEIIISGVNRQSIYGTQFKLFLLGTFLGILVSLITTILFEFVQKYESKEPINWK